MKLKYFSLFIYLCLINQIIYQDIISVEEIKTDITNTSNIKNISVNIKLNKDELLYQDSFYVTVDNPNIILSKPISKSNLVSIFDPLFKESKYGYKDSVSFNFTAEKKEDTKNNIKADNFTVHIFFNTNLKKEPYTKLININFDNSENKNKINNNKDLETDNEKKELTDTQIKNKTENISEQSFFSKIKDYLKTSFYKLKIKLESLFETTGSRWLRYLVTFILGVLLSLTPCIYPMIPITIGVLQSSENKSVFRNFLVSLSYTLGISCTFAIFGFVTAIGSAIFGQLQNTAWLVLPLIFLLIYLGLSMFGLYEMYIPKFMHPKDNSNIQKGSYISAFIFGIISGAVASPCLSPGLALVLAHVAKITKQANILNYLDGFASLFLFGVGSSLPLLIIGTFSGSINFLPKAGIWMVEVKKILGLMLIGMAFYYLSNFISFYILSIIIIIFLFAVAINYFLDNKPYYSPAIIKYKNLMGILFIVLACLIAVSGYKDYYNYKYPADTGSIWSTDYNSAKDLAQKENKKLLLDFVTTNCSMCKVIEKKLFDLYNNFKNNFSKYILVKIDGSDANNEIFAKLHKIINLKGFPTIVIMDPVTETPLKIWSGDIGNSNNFIAELEKN